MIIVNGNKIRKLREEKGLSRKEFAKMLETSELTIYHFESCNRMPNIRQLKITADCFGLKVDDFIIETEINLQKA